MSFPSVETNTFSVLCASKLLLILLLPSWISLTDPYLSSMWPELATVLQGRLHRCWGEGKNVFIYLVFTFLYGYVWYLLSWFFVASFQQPETVEQFEIHKTFLKNQISQSTFECSAPHGLQAFCFKPLERQQLWKVSVPHICVWQSRANSFETFPIFENCLRDELVLGLAICSLSHSQYCSDCKNSGSVHHFIFQNTKNTCP